MYHQVFRERQHHAAVFIASVKFLLASIRNRRPLLNRLRISITDFNILELLMKIKMLSVHVIQFVVGLEACRYHSYAVDFYYWIVSC